MSSKVNGGSCKYVYGSLVRKDFNDNKIDNNSSIVINISNCELPYIEDDSIDDVRIKAFHSYYYNILIGLSLIDELMGLYDKEFLNQRLVRLFKLYSSFNCNIKDIDMFRELLVCSRDTYYNECNKYANNLECGSLLSLVIITINLTRFINIVKESLEIDRDFKFIINIGDDVSKLSLETLEKLINSKYDRSLSISVSCTSVKLNSNLARVKVVN